MAVWNFSENSSGLVGTSFPKSFWIEVDFVHFKLRSVVFQSWRRSGRIEYVWHPRGNSSTNQDHQFTGRLNQIVIQPTKKGKWHEGNMPASYSRNKKINISGKTNVWHSGRSRATWKYYLSMFGRSGLLLYQWMPFPQFSECNIRALLAMEIIIVMAPH